MARLRLGEILVKAGVLAPSDLESALREQVRWGGQLGRILVDKGFVSEELLVKALARQLNFPVARIDGVAISKKVLDLVPAELADQHGLLPFQQQGKFLDVAMSDPMNLGIIDELRIRTQLNVRPYLAAPSAIRRAIAANYDLSELSSEVVIDGDFGDEESMALESSRIIHRRRRRDSSIDPRQAEIEVLQKRISRLETLIARDEDVIRKLLGLLVEKGVASRDEILEAIK